MASPKLHIKKNDTVVVLSGKDKGKKGTILQVMPGDNRVIVERINVVKKHSKPNKKVKQGGIVDMEAPLNASKVMLVCDKCGKPSRTGSKILANEEKVRVCKRCGAELG